MGVAANRRRVRGTATSCSIKVAAENLRTGKEEEERVGE